MNHAPASWTAAVLCRFRTRLGYEKRPRTGALQNLAAPRTVRGGRDTKPRMSQSTLLTETAGKQTSFPVTAARATTRPVNSVTRVARPPDKPLLIFDGDCTFCRCWIARWKQATGERVDYVPLQSESISARFPELSRDQLESAVHLVEPDGQVTRGAAAVFRSLAVARRWPLWAYENLPGFAPASECAYRIVARHRAFFSLLTRWFWGRHIEQPSHWLVRWLFLRLLGLTYFIAFLSLNAQLPGLIGSNGIVPAGQIMHAIDQNTAGLGLDRFRVAPTLCWFGTEDGFLRGLCVAGLALSALVVLNIATAPCLFLLWLIYLSLAQVSSVFLGYQWDNLLLETGLLAIFFAPLRLWPNLARESPPPRVVLWRCGGSCFGSCSRPAWSSF
jgi:predicted DCC family thiol-disulfide oxidoreductase YuxK